MSRLALSASPARAGIAESPSARTVMSRMHERIVVPPVPLLVDPRDLRPLDARPGHEPLLAEDEGVDVARDRVAGHGPPHALVDDDDARADADLEAVGRVELVERGLGHEEERVSELLHARLEPVRGGDGVVVAGDLAALEERALADLAAEHEARLHHRREHENALRLLAEELRTRLPRVEAVQRRAGLASELGAGRAVRRAWPERDQRRRHHDARERQRSGGSHHRLLSPVLRSTVGTPDVSEIALRSRTGRATSIAPAAVARQRPDA